MVGTEFWMRSRQSMRMNHSSTGRNTTAAVVNGIFLVVLADSLFVVIFHCLGLGKSGDRSGQGR